MKTHSISLALCMLLTAVAPAVATDGTWAGSGTQTSPYEIADLADIQALSAAVGNGETYAGQFFLVTADISGIDTPIGTSTTSFCGTFDGGSHFLTLAINTSAQGSWALFSKLGEGAHIRNVYTRGSVVNTHTSGYTAGIVGSATGTEESPIVIDNCHNETSVRRNMGVLGGVLAYGGGNVTVMNSTNAGKLTGTQTGKNGIIVGGIVGSMKAPGTVTNCCFGDTILTPLLPNTLGNYAQVGGIVGLLKDGCTVSNVCNLGVVIPSDDVQNMQNITTYLGNIVGYVEGNAATVEYGYFAYASPFNVRACGTSSASNATYRYLDYFYGDRMLQNEYPFVVEDVTETLSAYARENGLPEWKSNSQPRWLDIIPGSRKGYYNLFVTQPSVGTISPEDRTLVREGETVTLAYESANHVTPCSWRVEYFSGYGTVPVANGSFEMPGDDVEISVVLHQLSHGEAVPVTCMSDGNLEYWYCSMCNTYYLDEACTQSAPEESVFFPALGHNLTHKEAAEASCTTSGNIEYWYCSNCHTYFLDEDCTQSAPEGEVIFPALGHQLTHKEAVESTCTDGGNLEYWYCSRCNVYYLDEACTQAVPEEEALFPPLWHQLTHVDAVPVTCTSAGNAEYWYCSRCNTYFHDEACTQSAPAEDVLFAPLGHDLEHFEATESSCEEGSLEHWHCKRCNGYFLDEECTDETTAEEVHTALGHEYEGHFCTRCGKGEPAQLAEDGYYEIENVGNLYWFASHVNAGNNESNARLMNNITINENVLTSTGILNSGTASSHRVWTPMGVQGCNFKGIFDGQNHTISGLYMTTGSYIGLIAYAANATIANVTIADSYLAGSGNVGFICGNAVNVGDTIRNCHVTSGRIIASGNYCGGICGYLNGGYISGCTNKATIKGDDVGNGRDLGGIVGAADYPTCVIQECVNNGQVLQDYKSTQYFYGGGIAGLNKGLITRCFNTAKIVQYSPSWNANSSSRYVGGITGSNSGTLLNCYNLGEVTSNYTDHSYMGGICGSNGSVVSHCYNLGRVDGYAYVGAICGSSSSNTLVTQNFYLANTARSHLLYGTSDGGVVQYGIGTKNYNENLADVEGKTISATSGEFSSGAICYALNDNSSTGDNLVWFQTLGTDASPLLEGLVVYYDVATESYTNTAPPIYEPGDVNGDGMVNVSDVTALVSIILGNTPMDAAADVNGDGVVNVSDVTALVSIILGN